MLEELSPDATVIPGHGKIADVPTLRRYIEMLQTVRDRIAAMIDAGKSLEEVAAAKPTHDFDATFGASAAPRFVDRVYTSLRAQRD